MKRSKTILTAFISAAAMLVLILDSKTAALGAAEGISLCIRTVIPALFPLMVLSCILTDSLFGQAIPLLRPIGRICGIPEGAESLLIPAIAGGYPVGAKCVAQAYTKGSLSKAEAQRMLSFCSNAGPSFIFGICALLFEKPSHCLLLWGIHIASALLTGILMPGKNKRKIPLEAGSTAGLPAPVTGCVKTMGAVCGWVILFRVLLAFCKSWFLWLLPGSWGTLFCGLLELTNGCCELISVPDMSTRFILCAGMLSFGGVCVMLQTASVIGELGIRSYVTGKLLQTLLSVLLASAAAQLLWGGHFLLLPAALLVLTTGSMVLQKKSSILRKIRI